MKGQEDMDMYQCKVGGVTFLIRIYFKQHANWQGTVQWLEANKTIPFRSVLELIALLNEAVEKISPENQGLDFRTWEEKENFDPMQWDLSSHNGKEGMS